MDLIGKTLTSPEVLKDNLNGWLEVYLFFVKGEEGEGKVLFTLD